MTPLKQLDIAHDRGEGGTNIMADRQDQFLPTAQEILSHQFSLLQLLTVEHTP